MVNIYKLYIFIFMFNFEYEINLIYFISVLKYGWLIFILGLGFWD